MTEARKGRAATPRERARVRTMDEITRIGRSQLAEHGAAALSLRAVARELGVVSSAVYRYVPSRDALLTLLIEDAYRDLGEAARAAEAREARDDFPGRWMAMARGVRQWAIREPARYGLLFGSPVPGYAAPAERTTEPGTAVIRLLLRIADDAHSAGALTPPWPATAEARASESRASESLPEDMALVRGEFGVSLPDEYVAGTTLMWIALFGAVSFEVFGQYGTDTFRQPERLFDHQMRLVAEAAGLRPFHA